MFDLVVLGSGSAAQTVASRCRAAGWTVAMVDKRPFGGTCALRGCDPKKVLVSAAAAVDAARLLAGKGVRSGGLAIDWADLIQFKRTFTDPRPEQLTASLARDVLDDLTRRPLAGRARDGPGRTRAFRRGAQPISRVFAGRERRVDVRHRCLPG